MNQYTKELQKHYKEIVVYPNLIKDIMSGIKDFIENNPKKYKGKIIIYNNTINEVKECLLIMDVIDFLVSYSVDFNEDGYVTLYFILDIERLSK